MQLKHLCATLLLAATPVLAAELTVSVEVPRLTVAEYHRPYVAVWLEKEGGVVNSLAVWYDVEMKEEKGKEWLKDMRQWWRRTGRELTLPLDGVTGATRAPGTHQIRFTEGQAPLGKLAAGSYVLLVEAAREVGGREVVKLPFEWPVKSAQRLTVQGEAELGAVELIIAP